MNHLLQTAINASLAAGRRIMEIYETEDFEVDFKGDHSPLTKADIASHQIIMSFLSETGIPVLSEEGQHLPYEERKNWRRLWIVDPLDGTKEFIKRNGEFTVNIALVEDGVPVLGVIYVPALKDLYFAAKEIGSFKVKGITHFSNIEDTLNKAVKLHQTTAQEQQTTNNKPYTVVASKSHLSPETEEFIQKLAMEKGKIETLSKGSSLKLCLIAEGLADCYPRFGPTMEWDTAAGHVICNAAGKTLLDLSTKEEMKYNRENLVNGWFLCH